MFSAATAQNSVNHRLLEILQCCFYKKMESPLRNSIYDSMTNISLVHYAGRLIASEGQTSAHVPHSVQASGLIEYLSPSEIAPTGHSSIHVPHAIQSSPIT